MLEANLACLAILELLSSLVSRCDGFIEDSILSAGELVGCADAYQFAEEFEFSILVIGAKQPEIKEEYIEGSEGRLRLHRPPDEANFGCRARCSIRYPVKEAVGGLFGRNIDCAGWRGRRMPMWPVVEDALENILVAQPGVVVDKEE